jgi:hypothetical protein
MKPSDIVPVHPRRESNGKPTDFPRYIYIPGFLDKDFVEAVTLFLGHPMTLVIELIGLYLGIFRRDSISILEKYFLIYSS